MRVSLVLVALLSTAPLSAAGPDGGGVLLPPAYRPAGGRVESSPASLLEPVAGEAIGGFPNWSERVMHEWINRARVDPAADLAGCGANCPENTGGCYTAQLPLIRNANAVRSARYHSSEMGRQAFFNHPSNCTLVSSIASVYPVSCDGSASCACVGGVTGTCPTCTDTWSRLSLFGVGGTGEIIAAGYGDADSAFYGWLWEPTSSATCAYSSSNGHRWLILKSTSAVGTGYDNVPGSPWITYYTGDFGDANSPIPKIPSGAHYPQQASSVTFWANWYDTAAPQVAKVDVDGVCTTMTLGRGTATNGAYTASASGVGSGCHRYYFDFVDANGNEVTYPTTGSFGIGTSGCADWSDVRPNTCAAPTTPAPTAYYALPPCRIVDTRNATGPLGGPMLAGSGATRTFTVTGSCGVPSNAKSVSANVTVVTPGGAGDLRISPGNLAEPGATTIHFRGGVTRANNAQLFLATTGAGSITVASEGGATHFILDVNGYYK